MKTTKAFILALTTALVVPTILLAGDKAGNGGDAIVCDASESAKTQAFMLDYYEAQRRQLPLKSYEPTQSVSFIVNDVLDRLSKVDPERVGNRYRAWAMALIDGIESAEKSSGHKNDFVQLVDADLTDIKDSNEISIPANCKKVQVAIFVGHFGGPFNDWYKRFNEDSYYTIHHPTYKVMNNVQRAWLVLHEVNYRELIMTYASVDSTGARYLNGKLFQGEVLALHDYLAALRQARIGFYVMQTPEYSIPIVTYFQADWFQPYEITGDQIVSVMVAAAPTSPDEYSGLNPAIRAQLKIADQTVVGSGSYEYNVGTNKFGKVAGHAQFTDSGRLKYISMPVFSSLTLKDGSSFSAMSQSDTYKSDYMSEWDFFADHIRVWEPGSGFIYIDKADGSSAKVKEIKFDYQGKPFSD